MKILVTGLTGLVGSRFQELLSNAYEFDEISLSTGINILDRKAVLDKVLSSDTDIVLHLAAKTNVDGCQEDKQKDKEAITSKNFEQIINEKTAYAVNVLGTQNVVNACEKANKKIIYISTDFVFNGQKKSYSEEDEPDPINWYGKTKFEGEKIVKNSSNEWMIIRPAYPYRALFKRNDFVRSIIDKLEKREKLNVITDHIMVPTFIDDLVNALDVLIKTNQTGIFHVTGSQKLTPYDAATKIAKEFNLDSSLIEKITRREYFTNKAPRPFCLNLKNDKIGKLGIEMSTFDKGLKEIKNQLEKINI